jgi:signal transduction histidine kinase
VGAMESDSFAEIFVQDNGKGISSKALEMINSKSFYTTKGTESESGTGLGLMLCREFLQKNEGKMHIESKEGDGSTFSFTLPMMENLKSSAKRSKAFN